MKNNTKEILSIDTLCLSPDSFVNAIFNTNEIQQQDWMYKNASHVATTCLHEAYYFWCVLAMSIYWNTIAYVGLWARVMENYGVPPGTLGILCYYYPVLYCYPLPNILFVWDTNTSYLITCATENIQSKSQRPVLKAPKIMVCNVRFCSQPTYFSWLIQQLLT